MEKMRNRSVGRQRRAAGDVLQPHGVQMRQPAAPRDQRHRPGQNAVIDQPLDVGVDAGEALA
jgi:hypothetical protein